MISVVVPILNEEQNLPAFLATAEQWNVEHELVFADGGSTDATLSLLASHAVVLGARGRGAQCRLGARHATGDSLVFMHVDSVVSPESMQAIADAFGAGARWGCLTLRFESASPLMTIAEIGSNLRVKISGIPFGDQTMFMTRQIYDEVGGMPAYPLMEDYELARRLAAIERPVQLPHVVRTSARRFHEGGIVKTMVDMRYLRHLYRKGVDPAELAHLYYGF